MRHVHLISWLTAKGSSVSQTFSCWEPKSIKNSTGRRRLTPRSLAASYTTLAVIRKLKHLVPFHVRKQLEECLILSKIDYNDIVSHPVPEYLKRRLQHVQLAAAGFVLGRYAHVPDVIKLGWIPMKERRENHLPYLFD